MTTTDNRFDGPGPDTIWWSTLAEGRFTLQQCDACGKHQFPPTVLCRACGRPEVSLVTASGHGRVYSTTTVRTRDGDRNVSIITLAEGPRMMSRVETAPVDAVRIGMAVSARIADDGEGGHAVVFIPAPDTTEGHA